MEIRAMHFTPPQTVAQARATQDVLRARLRIVDAFPTPLETIAGVDVGYDLARDLAHASIVVLTLDGLVLRAQARAYAPPGFPYVPGLLAFREIPAILAALAQLPTTPDVLMVDGHGIAHPRRMGIAAHLGVLLDLPSVGVAKSRLTGHFEEPGAHKGAYSVLRSGKEQIGVVLRSRERVKPLFVSPGHRVSMDTALALTLRCLTRYRLPEPTRQADRLSKCGKAARHDFTGDTSGRVP